MIVTNTSGQYTFVRGYALPPGIPVEIPNYIYLGNEDIKEQINSLYAQDRLHMTDPDELLTLPVLPEPENELPDNFYADEDSFEVQKGDVTALIGIESYGDEDYGIMELHSSTGSMVKITALCGEAEEASIFVSKELDEPGKLLHLEVNGMTVFELLTDGKIAFSGRTPIDPPTLDAGTASAEDVALVLIDLGLANAA